MNRRRTHPWARFGRTASMSFGCWAAAIALANLVLLDIITEAFDQAMTLLFAGFAAFASGWILRAVADPWPKGPIDEDL